MELRKKKEVREIEKSEVQLRVISNSLYTGRSMYRPSSNKIRDTLNVNKLQTQAKADGQHSAKIYLLNKNVRQQTAVLTPEERRQWNSYSKRKKEQLMAKASYMAQRNEGLSKQRVTGTVDTDLKELKRIRGSLLKENAENSKIYDARKAFGNSSGEDGKFFEESVDGLKDKTGRNNGGQNHGKNHGFKESRHLQKTYERVAQKEKKNSGTGFVKQLRRELIRERSRDRMKREQWIKGEAGFQEMASGETARVVSPILTPVRIKARQRMEEMMRKAAQVMVKAAKSVAMLLAPVLVPVLIFVMLLGAIMPTTMGGEYKGTAHVSAEVEFYRPYLEKYAAQYPGMENLVDLMLAMIMQEAGGESWIGTMNGDIMQSSESAGYPGPGYLTGEASIEQGVKYLATEVFNKAGLLDDPYNMEKTKLALQGYNYGSGYIDWALKNYGGYSEENAAIFSNIMASRLGWRNYGDKQYVAHVLRYYEISWDGAAGSVSTSEITNAETKNLLEQLSASWPADLDEGRKNIIVKGCTLVGYTSYDMYGVDTRSGKDLPRTLDCSSFIAWCFQKCGYTNVPYWSTTGTFIESANFRSISYYELKPGDIGLINLVRSGGTNHVGIYVGKDSSGNAMWLHCTSHACSGSSIVTGPRISYYPYFSIFYRYTGFK